MKKSATIILVLIALMAIIGFERIGKAFHFLVSDDRVARARQGAEAENFEDTNSKESRIEEQNSSPIALRSQGRGQADTITTTPIQDRSGEQSLEVSITGEISPVHFVRAAFVVGSTKPSKEQLDRLRNAVDAVAEALRPGAMILDADGLSPSGASVLLYTRDGFDLTTQVKSIYDTLEKASNHPLHGNPKVEQERFWQASGLAPFYR